MTEKRHIALGIDTGGTYTDAVLYNYEDRVVLSKAKSNLSSVIGSGTKYKSRSTGELESALGLSEVKLDKNGNYNIKIGFAETRKDGSSNAKIANIIEYGKSGQTAKPFMKPAKTSSKSKCIEVMKSTFDKEVNNI